MENIFNKAQTEKDIESFEKLIAQYEKLYFNIAYRMTQNLEDAKDIAQDAIIKIYNNLDQCYGDTYFKSWSCRIVTNTSLDFLRKRNKQYVESIDEQLQGEENDFSKQIEADILTPEEEMIKKERQEIILDSINQLSDIHKTVIILRDINDMNYEEISETTNVSLGTVKSRIARARANLKTILEEKMELNQNKNV